MWLESNNKLYDNGVLIKDKTITANGNTDSLKKTQAEQLLLFINVGTVSASDTITFTVQSSPDKINWYDHTSGAAISAAGNQLITETIVGPYVRVKWVVAGAGISMTGVDLDLVTRGGR